MSLFKKTFLSDEDGLSSKDYLLLVSTSLFFIFITIGLVLVLLDYKIDNMYINLLEMVSPVVMTIVGSVAGVEITQKIVDRNKKENEEIKTDDEEAII